MNRIYAAWRAEYCKADIEMDGYNDHMGSIGRPRSCIGTEKQIRKRAQRRASYWKRKAAKRLQSA